MAKFKLPEKLEGIKITTPKGRLSFPHLFEPTKYKEDSKAQYNCTILFPKNEDLSKLKTAMGLAQEQAFGKDKKNWPKNINLPWRDGDDKDDYEGYAGNYYLSAKTFNRPPVIDRQKQKIEDAEEIYGGCYGRLALVIKVTESGGKYYVTCYLQGVQKLSDGEKFGGGGLDVDSAFDDIDDEENDDLSSNKTSDDDSDEETDSMGF